MNNEWKICAIGLANVITALRSIVTVKSVDAKG